jgi:L-threonylcarbamoyladenylate synthase
MSYKEAELVNIDKNLGFAVAKAEKMYLAGTVFIYPTDTVPGFGANPFNEDAVSKINEIKGRDAGKMYILLINSIENLLKYIDIESEKHIDFLLSIWPNPVSVVLKLNTKTASLLGQETAAFRIPNHRFCLKLLEKLKMPLISTSVNRSTHPPLIEPSLIRDEFSSEVDTIFYTEKKSFYEASTIINLVESSPRLLREGKIKFEDLLQKFN